MSEGQKIWPVLEILSQELEIWPIREILSQGLENLTHQGREIHFLPDIHYIDWENFIMAIHWRGREGKLDELHQSKSALI